MDLLPSIYIHIHIYIYIYIPRVTDVHSPTQLCFVCLDNDLVYRYLSVLFQSQLIRSPHVRLFHYFSEKLVLMPGMLYLHENLVYSEYFENKCITLRKLINSFSLYWEKMIPTLAALDIVIMTTSSATRDDKVGIVTALSSLCESRCITEMNTNISSAMCLDRQDKRRPTTQRYSWSHPS